jgi:hypothetical protein
MTAVAPERRRIRDAVHHIPHPHVPHLPPKGERDHGVLDRLSVRLDDLDTTFTEEELIEDLDYYGPK